MHRGASCATVSGQSIMVQPGPGQLEIPCSLEWVGLMPFPFLPRPIHATRRSAFHATLGRRTDEYGCDPKGLLRHPAGESRLACACSTAAGTGAREGIRRDRRPGRGGRGPDQELGRRGRRGGLPRPGDGRRAAHPRGCDVPRGQHDEGAGPDGGLSPGGGEDPLARRPDRGEDRVRQHRRRQAVCAQGRRRFRAGPVPAHRRADHDPRAGAADDHREQQRGDQPPGRAGHGRPDFGPDGPPRGEGRPRAPGRRGRPAPTPAG